MYGQDKVTIEYGESYTDPGAVGVLRSRLIPGYRKEVPVSATMVPDELMPGETILRYRADCLWLHSIASRTLIVKAPEKTVVLDTVAPVISLVTVPDSYTLPGHPYVEEGYSAVDDRDGDITHLVVRTVTETEVIYTVTDAAGNATEVRRPIHYDDPVAPVLTLNGGEQFAMFAGSSFTDPGFTAVDNLDGDITNSVVVDGAVDIYRTGTYVLTYRVTDSYGNETSVSRTVNVNLGNKVIYLTFDDGPSNHTQRLLDILAQYNVKATFFVTNQIPYYVPLMKNIVEGGHSIGIHTYTHNYSTIYASKEAFFEDFYKTREMIYQQTGIYTNLSRFPGGSGGTRLVKKDIIADLNEMGYQYFDWNIDSMDTQGLKTGAEIAAHVISEIQKRDVSCVLQHDLYGYSVDAVAAIIEWGLANGYTFLPLADTSPTFHQKVPGT